jgi:ParB family chromosome partitioning protein
MHIQHIPLSKLTPSKSNVRRTGAANGIDELAASIAAHGLLQNLAVREAGKQRFEVVAGGRRLAALKRLAKEKRLTKDAPIPCNVLDEEDAEEISLAENVVRLPMHPADQFEAFQRLVDSGKGREEIAARFGVSITTVKQRLKLANVSPVLMEAYRAEELDLDRLIAFAVTDDHAAQEACWRGLPSWSNGPNTIRRMLTHAQIDASDRRARFVGLEAYQEAGGQITRDLFQPEHEGWLADAALLERLVTQKLEALADTIRAEGWKWVQIEPEHGQSLCRIQPERLPLKPEQEEELARLSAQYDALPEDDETDEQAEQRESLYAQLEALAEGEAIWTDTQKSIAGVIIRIRHDGDADIDRGLVKPEDRAALRHLAQPDDTEDGESDGGRSARPAGLSAKLVGDLTAHRTAALQALMVDNPLVALAATVHALACPVFYGAGITPTCLEITVRQPDLTRSSDSLASSPAAQLLEERRSAWQSRLPEDQDGLFAWLLAQDLPTLTDLLALATAVTVNAVRQPGSHHASPRVAHADQLATALGLNMTAWWQPTGATYLGRVSKAHILDAVKEGVSPEAAENLSTLKKGDLVARAEERLTGQGWLPLALRGAA